MLKNKNILCISSIDWDFIWQGHQEIMSTLANNGNKVFFIENTGVRSPGIRDISRLRNRVKNWLKGIKGIRKESENLYIFSPVILPFPYSRIARWINRRLILRLLKRWMKAADFTDPIIWNFLPTGLALDLIDNLDNKIVIYYCLDNLKIVSNNVGQLEKYERRIIEKSDLVFVTSDNLYEQCSKYTENIYKFPFTVNIEKFDREKLASLRIPDDMMRIKGPVIGFSGGVRKWIDKDLVKYIVESNPEYSFVFVGPLQMDVGEFRSFKNIYFLGQKAHSELPLYVNSFDVAVIPYLKNDFTQCISPAKLNEYFALGKPVVATNLAELQAIRERHGNIIYTADTAEEFNNLIHSALSEKNDELVRKRIEVARENSWENYIEKMSRLIDEAISIKKLNGNTKWKENFTAFYKKARRRFFKIGVTLAVVYLLVFYTPIMWIIAEPLKILQMPQKSDSIVIFGGGAGESGCAGQGLEERVSYAVELYKKGYAPNMIFSSGYMYKYKESVEMKKIALSLGIPENAILLEDRAVSTYQNALFTTELLRSRRWNQILLVSSPYHMRRASLVFKCVDNDIRVICTPAPSKFYEHKGRFKQMTAQQLKGILHEYLSIVFYWWKGYI